MTLFRKKIAAAAAQGSLSVNHKAGGIRAKEDDTCDVDNAKQKSGGTFAASRE
jgi:hypothetical protein